MRIYLILFFIIFIIFMFTYTQKEYYTIKLDDVSLSTCGTICTEGVNCSGFGYKPKKKTCYLSKKSIFGIPYDENYEKDYSKLDKRCNKINKINDDTIFANDIYTRNSVYSCSDGEKNIPNIFQFANYGSTYLNDFENQLLPEKVNYDTYYIDWDKKSIQQNKIFVSKTYDRQENIDIEYID